jgi:hypothetical protein
LAEAVADSDGALDAAADEDEEPEAASGQDSDGESPRQQGLVASAAPDS